MQCEKEQSVVSKAHVGSKLLYILLACRPQFLTASVVPVVVGSCLGYVVAGEFHVGIFVLAMFAMMALQAGANVANDYFDHLSKNDWVNKNATRFSGGSGYIQKGILSPKATLLISVLYLTTGAILGLVIVMLTGSLFILTLGLVGLVGAFFYTAGPVKFGYRSIGEPLIGLLFGVLPVYGAYYLQTKTIDMLPLLPGLIVGLNIFLVILINEFPDVKADAAVGKKTLVVTTGIMTSIWVYRLAAIACFVVAGGMLFYPVLFYAGLFYFLMLPLAIAAIKRANKENLCQHGNVVANQVTILMHSAGTLPLAVGFFVGYWF